MFSARETDLGKEAALKAFVVACLVAIALAAISRVVLNNVQEPVDQAFATPYARVGT